MRDRAFEKIGRHYRKVPLPDGREGTVIAWLWARTVPCSSPGCGIHMPLMSTFQVSKKKGKERWVRPFADQAAKRVRFEVQDHPRGIPEALGGRTVKGTNVVCAVCGTHTKTAYVREQAKAGRMGAVMTAIVADGRPGRVFLSPTEAYIDAAHQAEEPAWRPEQDIPKQSKKLSPLDYGCTHWHELFTKRQLLAVTTFCDLIPEVREQILRDGADEAYADAVTTYLALAMSKYVNFGSSFSRWELKNGIICPAFTRQAIAMMWDYAETNPFSHSSGSYLSHIDWIAKAVALFPETSKLGRAFQADAVDTEYSGNGAMIATDPPYYDNISYAELSDFFYVWLRPLLRNVYPELFGVILTPKDEEMIAAPRFKKDGIDPAKRFEELMLRALARIQDRCSKKYPSSIIYGYKQETMERDGRKSTGWETFLSAAVDAGLEVRATWPMQTERKSRPNAQNTNSLISSVVLVCVPRSSDAKLAFRLDFLAELKKELPEGLKLLESVSRMAPVDLRQAAIGLGMGVYSRHARVERQNGDHFEVWEAMQAINDVVDEYLRGEVETAGADGESRFCLDWLRSFGFEAEAADEAMRLARPFRIGTDGLKDTVMEMERGKARLFRISDYEERELKAKDAVGTAWEGCFRMASELDLGDEKEGVAGAGKVMHRMRRSGVNMYAAQRLAHALYGYFDGRDDSREAVLFNYLVWEWDKIDSAADKAHDLFAQARQE